MAVWLALYALCGFAMAAIAGREAPLGVPRWFVLCVSAGLGLIWPVTVIAVVSHSVYQAFRGDA